MRRHMRGEAARVWGFSAGTGEDVAGAAVAAGTESINRRRARNGAPPPPPPPMEGKVGELRRSEGVGRLKA